LHLRGCPRGEEERGLVFGETPAGRGAPNHPSDGGSTRMRRGRSARLYRSRPGCSGFGSVRSGFVRKASNQTTSAARLGSTVATSTATSNPRAPGKYTSPKFSPHCPGEGPGFPDPVRPSQNRRIDRPPREAVPVDRARRRDRPRGFRQPGAFRTLAGTSELHHESAWWIGYRQSPAASRPHLSGAMYRMPRRRSITRPTFEHGRE